MEPVTFKHGSIAELQAFPSIREGLSVSFRGEDPEGEYVEVDLVVAPLNLRDVQKLRAFGKRESDLSPEERMHEETLEMLRMALRRNYKGVPAWLIEQSIDPALMRNIMASWAEMARVSFEKKA